jgi:hypothetical protein
MENRLELAKKLGADFVFKANDPNVLDEIKKRGPITQSFEWYSTSSLLLCLFSPLFPHSLLFFF